MFSTGAELWREWERRGVLRAQDYDRDVCDRVRAALGCPASKEAIADLLDAAAWSPRDLIHALAPLVSSFVGMMRDLLALLTRVGATSGTGESLRVVYEFTEGDLIDDSLSDFRETVQRIEQFTAKMPSLTFDYDHAWSSPIWELGRSGDPAALLGVDSGDLTQWRLVSVPPSPAPTGRARVDAVVQRYFIVLRALLDRLASLGGDLTEVREWLGTADSDADASDVALGWASTDFWLPWQIAAVHQFADEVRDGSRVADEELLDAIEGWLAGFQSDEFEEATVERLVEELTDVLSLPEWGRRHELYSAWVASQIDQALGRSRLEFVVKDGALRFPFRPTLLARLDPPSGDIELWCEVRSPAIAPLGEGRKGGIQPDYQFRRTDAQGCETVAAVEVKQYLKPANKNPGEALHDYVMALPSATVLLVAHGPLGARVLDYVPNAQRHRARVHPHVRVGCPRQSAAFREDVAKLFPAAVETPMTHVELRWTSGVHDLDIHVLEPDGDETSWQSRSTRHSSLRADAFDGGPEVIDLETECSGPLQVWVHLYSSDAASVQHAAPQVSFVWEDGRVLVLEPHAETQAVDARRWFVGEIDVSRQVRVSRFSRARDAAKNRPGGFNDG